MSETEERPVSDNTVENARRGNERVRERGREGVGDSCAKTRGVRSMWEREKGRERKKGWKKRRVRGTNCPSFSLSLSFLPFLAHAREERERERGALEGRGTSRRSETKLVAFRETRDGADGGDGGTPAQKRITRVITTLINK